MNNRELRELLSGADYDRNDLPEMGVGMLDIRFSCSPSIRFLCADEGQAKHVADVLETRILHAIADVMGGRKYEAAGMFLVEDEEFVSARFVDVESRFTPIDVKLARLSEGFKAPIYSTETKLGWWRVDGLRRGCLLLATSESEAVEKAEAAGINCVQDATFVGAALPEIIHY